MIAGSFLAAHPFVDAGINQAHLRSQQQMVDAQPRIGLPMLAKIIPERVDALVRIARAQRVGPALRQQTPITFAAFGLQQRILEPRSRVVDVVVGRHHIEIARDHHRMAAIAQRRRMGDQALEPRQLVVELGARLGIAIGQVQAGHQHAFDRRLQIAALRIVVGARQAAPNFHWVGALGQNRHAIPRLLAVPDGAVTGRTDLVDRKAFVHRLQLLKTRDVGRFARQPRQQRLQACAHTVDIECGDLQ